MTRAWLNTLGAAALAAALLAAAGAVAQEFGEWDANADSLIDDAEWNTGFGGTSVLGDWDADDDAAIDEDEWNTGLGAGGFDAAEFGAFGDWDENDDDRLDANEFNRGFFNYDDRDDAAGLSEAEFGESEDLLD
jgi:hypothetical protein